VSRRRREGLGGDKRIENEAFVFWYLTAILDLNNE